MDAMAMDQSGASQSTGMQNYPVPDRHAVY